MATTVIITSTLISILSVISVIFQAGLLFKGCRTPQFYINVSGHRNSPRRTPLAKGRRWDQPPTGLPAYTSCRHVTSRHRNMIVSFLLLLQPLGKAVPRTHTPRCSPSVKATGSSLVPPNRATRKTTHGSPLHQRLFLGGESLCNHPSLPGLKQGQPCLWVEAEG